MSPSTILLIGSILLGVVALLLAAATIVYREDDNAFFLLLGCLLITMASFGCFDKAVEEARNERKPVPVVDVAK